MELLHLCIREGAREYITKPLHPIYKDVLLKHVSAQARRTRDAADHELLETLPEEEEGDGEDGADSRAAGEEDDEADQMRHSGLWANLPTETHGGVSLQDSDADHMNSKLGSSHNRNTVVGTPYYMSPEVIRKDHYDETIDWWAFGVLVFECTLGKYPFQGKTALELFRQIRRAQPDLSSLRDSAEGLHEMVAGLLRKDRRTRLGAKGAHEIKQHLYFAGLDFDQVSTMTTLFRPPCDNHETAMQQIEKGRALFYAQAADTAERQPAQSKRPSLRTSLSKHRRKSAPRAPMQLDIASRTQPSNVSYSSSVLSSSGQQDHRPLVRQPTQRTWTDDEWAADEEAMRKELGI